MNKEAVGLWAEALAGGQYAQIPYPMHERDGFNALGVLCEVYRKRFGGEWAPARPTCKELEGKPPDVSAYMEFKGGVHCPPNDVMAWLDLRCGCGSEREHSPDCEADRVLQACMTNLPFEGAAKILKEMAR